MTPRDHLLRLLVVIAGVALVGGIVWALAQYQNHIGRWGL